MELGRPDAEILKQDQQRGKPMAAQHPPPPPQKCPRCESSNTKFCYYNNYSLSQPRYFCKACRRYWTHGGTLRNVPVGGGCRKSKRPKPSPSPSVVRNQALPSSSSLPNSANLMMASGYEQFRALPTLPIGNSFYSGSGVLPSLSSGVQSSFPTSSFGQLHQPHTQHQLQPQTELFPSQQSFNFPSWPAQSFFNKDKFPMNPNFWSGGAGTDSGDQIGSSLNQSRYPGFDPPQ